MKARLIHMLSRILLLPVTPPTPILGATVIHRLSSSRKIHTYALIKWLCAQLLVLSGILMVLFADELTELWSIFVILKVLTILEQELLKVVSENVRWLLFVGTIIGYVWQLLQSFFFLWIRPRARWYLVTNQGIQIRDGIWTISETSIRFPNIQEVTLKQGALQRIFGLADIEVRTAGGDAKASGKQNAGETAKIKSHLGVFRDIEDAEHIRDIIRSHLVPTQKEAAETFQADQGLSSTAPENGILQAAHSMLTEVQALRQALTGSRNDPGIASGISRSNRKTTGHSD